MQMALCVRLRASAARVKLSSFAATGGVPGLFAYRDTLSQTAATT